MLVSVGSFGVGFVLFFWEVGDVVFIVFLYIVLLFRC